MLLRIGPASTNSAGPPGRLAGRCRNQHAGRAIDADRHSDQGWAGFIDLICADRELLRSEFDAIVTAGFAKAAEHLDPQLAPPRLRVATARFPTSPRRAAWMRAVKPPRGPGRRADARQRSPPPPR